MTKGTTVKSVCLATLIIFAVALVPAYLGFYSLIGGRAQWWIILLQGAYWAGLLGIGLIFGYFGRKQIMHSGILTVVWGAVGALCAVLFKNIVALTVGFVPLVIGILPGYSISYLLGIASDTTASYGVGIMMIVWCMIIPYFVGKWYYNKKN